MEDNQWSMLAQYFPPVLTTRLSLWPETRSNRPCRQTRGYWSSRISFKGLLACSDLPKCLGQRLSHKSYRMNQIRILSTKKLPGKAVKFQQVERILFSSIWLRVKLSKCIRHHLRTLIRQAKRLLFHHSSPYLPKQAYLRMTRAMR